MKGRAAELQNLESGTGDIADVGEWLVGNIKMPTNLREQKEEQKQKHQLCRKLPSMIYICMGHSGSTTLSYQLNAHPE